MPEYQQTELEVPVETLHAGNGWENPPTRRNLQVVLALGFAMVFILLLSAGYVSISGLESIESAAAALEQDQNLTSRIVAETQGEQAALSAIFYKLSGDPEQIDRDSILEDLDQADQNLSRMMEDEQNPVDELLWRQLEIYSREFTKEARRLLNEESGERYLSADMFHRHDQINSLVSKLVAAEGHRATEAQTQIRVQSDQLRRRSGMLMAACLILALVCAYFTVRMTTQLMQRMEEQSRQMNRVSWQLLQSQESAARRFSHELHDELGQSLAAMKANLSILQGSSLSDESRLTDCRQLVDEAVSNVRELSHLLRPTILDDFGLEAGLRWLTERFSQRTGIEVHYESSYSGRLPDATETHLFRIAQEALTNISKYSKATQVVITLTASSNEVNLLIRDNGVGMNPNAHKGSDGLGLIGMQARAESAGGKMELKTAPGAGMEIRITVPRVEQFKDPADFARPEPTQEWHEREEDAHIAG